MDYTEMCRSNYFKVKDEKKFSEFVRKTGCDLLKKDGYGFGFKKDGCIPDSIQSDKEEDLDISIDFMEELSGYLMPKEIAIVQVIGNEGMRYFNGYAVAVDHKGKQVEVSLHDIYDLVQKKFKTTPTKAEY